MKNAKLNEHFINQINTFLTLEGITLGDTNKELKTKLNFWNLMISCINNLYDISNSNYKNDGYYKSKSNNDINGCKYCGLEYYKIYNDIANTNSYYKCHKSLDGYYIDYNDLFYKPCYSSCKKCKINGNITNHNCIECANDYKYELDDIYFINCYNICSYYFYYDIDKNKSYCTAKFECPENYRYLIPAKNECIYNCRNDIIYKYEYNKKCYDKCPKYTLEKELFFCDDIKTADEFILYMKQFFINEVNISYIEDGNDIEEKRENVLVTITTTNKQKSDINDNETIFDLGLCEDELKYFYNISKNDSLFIFKIDIEIKGMKIPKIFYEIYYPLYNNTPSILDLSICNYKYIDLLIPVILNDTIDKYNSSSDYYNNICSKSDSKYNIDISLKDRKQEFIDNNMTICEENCKFVDYNYTNKKAKCSCEIKIKLPFIDEIKFNTDDLAKSFLDIKNIANIGIMKCYKIVFNLNCIKNNYGFYIFCFIIILFFIILIIFYRKHYLIIKKIREIYLAKKKQANKNCDLEMKESVSIKKIKANKIKKNDNTNIKTKIKSIKKKKINNKYFPPKNKKIKLNTSNINNNIRQKNKSYKLNNNNNSKKKSNSKTEKSLCTIDKKILEKNDIEINSLTYKEAIKNDKRSFIQYYISLLKLGHLFIFSFYNNKDYNSRPIKIFLFFFIFTIHFTVNALFFNDATMHKIYIDEGSYNFIYQIPQILYSSLISGIIKTLIKYLSLSENDIINFKRDKVNKLDSEYKRLKKSLKIKFILFFIISFFLLIIFGYYITCFCCIYSNTQLHLIKDTVVSFCLSLLYPFGIYLIPAMFRSCALDSKKKNKKCLYKLSLILQKI